MSTHVACPQLNSNSAAKLVLRRNALKPIPWAIAKYNGAPAGLFVYGNRRRVRANQGSLPVASRVIWETVVMSELTNKQIMQDIFTGLAKGDPQRFVESMADHFRWIVGAATTWSKTLDGKNAVLTELFGSLSHCRWRLRCCGSPRQQYN